MILLVQLSWNFATGENLEDVRGAATSVGVAAPTLPEGVMSRPPARNWPSWPLSQALS